MSQGEYKCKHDFFVHHDVTSLPMHPKTDLHLPWSLLQVQVQALHYFVHHDIKRLLMRPKSDVDSYMVFNTGIA